MNGRMRGYAASAATLIMVSWATASFAAEARHLPHRIKMRTASWTAERTPAAAATELLGGRPVARAGRSWAATSDEVGPALASLSRPLQPEPSASGGAVYIQRAGETLPSSAVDRLASWLPSTSEPDPIVAVLATGLLALYFLIRRPV